MALSEHVHHLQDGRIDVAKFDDEGLGSHSNPI
jgi:hypothetical protein